MKGTYIKAAISVLLPSITFFWNPLALTEIQNLLFAAIVLGIALWATEIVNRTIVSLGLLVVFVAISGVSMERIFTFPLSSNFITIVSSFLLSAGVVNSGVAKKVADAVLNRYCKSLVHLVIAACFLNLLLAVVIPQPIPRITLLGSIYFVLLSEQNLKEEQKRAVLLSVFVTATTTAMVLRTGDVVLNNAALGISGVDLSQTEWIRHMTVPSLLASALLVLSYILYQKKHLSASIVLPKQDSIPLTMQGKKTCLLMALVVLLWVTESIHGLSPAWVSLIGVVLMFLFQILKRKDLKTINLGLLIFLTAEFGLGNVLADSGIADAVSSLLKEVMPGSDTIFLPLLLMCLSIYVLHTLFGGAMGALAVSLPIVIAIWGDTLNPYIIALTALVLVTCQYVFPYNQLTILVGYGQKYYGFKDVMKLTLLLTPLVLIFVFGIYVPWWKFSGLL